MPIVQKHQNYRSCPPKCKFSLFFYRQFLRVLTIDIDQEILEFRLSEMCADYLTPFQMKKVTNFRKR